jgi:nitronate monooxygenase
VKIPVIAAGGIADGRGIAAAFALGASGVQMGTAYLLCREATISPIHRAAIKSAKYRTSIRRYFDGRTGFWLRQKVVAAVNIAASTANWTPERVEAELSPITVEVARQMSKVVSQYRRM